MNYHDWLPGESLQEMGVSKESEVRNLFFVVGSALATRLYGAPPGGRNIPSGSLGVADGTTPAFLPWFLGPTGPTGNQFSDFLCRLHPGE